MELEQALMEIETLKSQLEKFKGVNLDEVTRDRQSLSEQLANTQRQFNEFKAQAETDKATLQTELQSRDMRSEFQKLYTAQKGDPAYESVLFTTAAAGLQLKDGVVQSKDGKPLTEVVNHLRETYPRFFLADETAGSGATGSNTTATSNVKTVSPKDGIISGVDPQAVLKGEVVIR